MILDSLVIDAETFSRLSGWQAKPEGMCKDERCVPVAKRSDGLVDVADFADRLKMPILHDDKHGLWAVGPEGGGGKFLQTAVCPEIVLPDLDDNPFRLSSLHGKKVLLVAWASW